MTWAQGTFAFCFGIIVPAVGVLSAVGVRREGKSALKGFAFAFGVTLLALVACCFIAHFLFPRYPSEPIPEVVANAFTLPTVVVGLCMILFTCRRSSLRFRSVSSTALIVLYLVGIFLSYQFFTWGFRKALPYAASDIHESYWEDSLLPDYGYHLKAKVTEGQFRAYIAGFRLTPHTPTRIYSDYVGCLAWGRSDPPLNRSWWDPSPSLESTHVSQAYHTWTFAKYERGYLYLESLRH